MRNIYHENGYADRAEYLRCLAEDFELDLDMVVMPIANLFGPREDFDGLVSMLEAESSKT